jgi:putative hydrolase of the HAD superfamily
VFDLDGVLYDGANGYLAHVRARQRKYLRERFGMTAREAAATRAKAFERASQCYKGLRDLGLDVESQEAFTAYCRDGVEAYLTPNDALASCLRAMPYRKVVMTNTSETQGAKALAALRLDATSSDAFEKVYGGVFTAPACKPQREAFEKVFTDLGRDVDPRRCVMFEDSMKNVKAAKSFGMTTVFVRTRGEDALDEDVETYCDAVVDEIDFEQLRRQLPELFA